MLNCLKLFLKSVNLLFHLYFCWLLYHFESNIRDDPIVYIIMFHICNKPDNYDMWKAHACYFGYLSNVIRFYNALFENQIGF